MRLVPNSDVLNRDDQTFLWLREIVRRGGEKAKNTKRIRNWDTAALVGAKLARAAGEGVNVLLCLPKPLSKFG